MRPTFTHTIGMPGPGRVVGGEHQRAAVLEALDVGGDHADLGLVGEVAGEVGELEVDLVAGRRPVRERDAELLGLEHRAALVAALGDEGDRRPGEVVAERLERVEVGVRPEQVGARRSRPGRSSRSWSGLAVRAGLGEAGREDHREPGLLLEHRLEHVDGVADQDDGEVDARRARRATERKQGTPSTVSRLGLTGMTSAPARSPQAADLAPHGCRWAGGLSDAPITATVRGGRSRRGRRRAAAVGRPVTSTGTPVPRRRPYLTPASA